MATAACRPAFCVFLCLTWIICTNLTDPSSGARRSNDPISEPGRKVLNAKSDVAVRIHESVSVDENCNTKSFPSISLTKPPAIGYVIIRQEPFYTNFPASNAAHYHCNFNQTLGIVVYYKFTHADISKDDKPQTDQMSITETYDDGRSIDHNYLIQSVPLHDNLTDNPLSDPNQPLESPSTRHGDSEMKETAYAGYERVLVRSYSLNPDCSVPGEVRLSVRQSPKHGVVHIDSEKAFAIFPIGDPYFKCYGFPVRKSRVVYLPKSGYVGPDMISVEYIFSSGHTTTKDISINVE